MEHPDYMVIRFAPNLPKDAVPEQYDGMWVDVSQLVKDEKMDPHNSHVMGCRTVITDRLETRRDGEVGQVWEIQPRQSRTTKMKES